MKVIATNIFDFTNWYKFGYKTFAKDAVIDLSDVLLTGETVLKKTGFFEEEYEIFYLEFKNDLLNTPADLITLSLHDIDFIIPISESGARMLQTKIPDFRISEPLEPFLFDKLINARNNFLAREGAKRIWSSFDIGWKPEYENLQENFIQSLNKYKADLNAKQETILDQIVFYERSKPFPLSEIGFLYDVGSIGKSWFKLSDEDFKQKNELKINDTPKYELIEEMIDLSKFLQRKQSAHVWTPFMEDYNTNNLLQNLNKRFSLSSDLQINNLLTIAFYLKFRELIRNTRLLEERSFTDIINKHLKKVPEETKVALLLNGLFFGGLKFKELYYKYVPLNITKLKFVRPVEVLPELGLIEEKDKSEGNNEKEDSNEIVSQKIILDPSLWILLEPTLKGYHHNQIKKIKKHFDVQSKNGDIFKEEKKLFINELKKEVAKSKKLQEKSKITDEMVADIERKLEEIIG